MITEEEVRDIFDAPEPPADEAPRPLGCGGILAYVFIALLAAVTILIEAATHLCATELFDPLPTKLHLAVLIPVPVLLLLTSHALAKEATAAGTLRLLMCANGFLFTVSLVYTALFLPLMPFAVIAIAFYGIGLLPLSPSLVLAASFFQLLDLCYRTSVAGIGGVWRRWLSGFALAAFVLGGWYGYTGLLDQAMKKAWSSVAEERDAGVRRIRLLHGEHYVLANCFRQGFRMRGLWADAHSMNDARALYSRLTGRDYREDGIPSLYFAFTRNSNRRKVDR